MESCYEVFVHSCVHISVDGRSSSMVERPVIALAALRYFCFHHYFRLQATSHNFLSMLSGAIGPQALWLELVIAAACKIF